MKHVEIVLTKHLIEKAEKRQIDIRLVEECLTHIIHKFRQIYCQAKYWSDFDSPSVTWMFKRAVVASEEGRMPSENEAEIICLTYDKTL